MTIALYMDPPSQHFLGDRLFDSGMAKTGGDQILAPYIYLRNYLAERGIPVRTADYLPERPDGAVNVYVSTGVLLNYKRLAKRKDVILSAFLAMECPTVEPGAYRELAVAQNYFRRVLSWSTSAALLPFTRIPLRCEKLYWPQSFDGVHEDVWRRTDRGFLVMINGNKFPRYRSACPELYTERLRAVEYFSRTGEINLYGVGWDRPRMIVGTPYMPGTFGRMRRPRIIQALEDKVTQWRQKRHPDPLLAAARSVYRGRAESKPAVLGAHKFAICFENSILDGWITEKIFDCFFAGTVPVYWGAPDIEQHIPKKCFIDMRGFQDYAGLAAFLRSLSDREIGDYRQNAREFLNSAAYRPFTRQAYAERFAGMIEQDTGARLERATAAQSCP